MLQGQNSAILWTFNKLPIVIKIFAVAILVTVLHRCGYNKYVIVSLFVFFLNKLTGQNSTLLCISVPKGCFILAKSPDPGAIQHLGQFI